MVAISLNLLIVLALLVILVVLVLSALFERRN